VTSRIVAALSSAPKGAGGDTGATGAPSLYLVILNNFMRSPSAFGLFEAAGLPAFVAQHPHIDASAYHVVARLETPYGRNAGAAAQS
jgi:hypothetical protein